MGSPRARRTDCLEGQEDFDGVLDECIDGQVGRFERHRSNGSGHERFEQALRRAIDKRLGVKVIAVNTLKFKVVNEPVKNQGYGSGHGTKTQQSHHGPRRRPPKKTRERRCSRADFLRQK